MDRSGDGVVSYDEFLVALRGELNDRRRETVDKAFEIMDHDVRIAMTSISERSF